jgi:hypothetical protein
MTQGTNNERIRALEVGVAADRVATAHRDASTDKALTEINEKLDELIALRNKGIGAFWLASALAGTGIVGALAALWEWIRH